jgi:GNAT superfamily N-acetyltransferase
VIACEEYAPHLRLEVVSLLDLIWGWSDLERSSAFFQWRYEDNPYTTTPVVFAARDGDRVVGLRCFVVQKFRRGPDTALVACPADAIVHPDYRGLGVFQSLTRFSLEHMPRDVRVILSLSANEASAAVNRKLGWKEFGMTKYMYRIAAPAFKQRERGSSTRTLEHRGVTVCIGEDPALLSPSTYSYPRIADTQWANVRDEAYYRWRYRQPFASFWYVTGRNGEQGGFMILKRMGRRLFSVMEYGFDDAAILSAMTAGFTRASEAYALRLLNLTLQSQETAAFRRAGFRYEPRWLLRLLNKHRAGALVQLVHRGNGTGSPPAMRASEVTGEDRWHIDLADVH